MAAIHLTQEGMSRLRHINKDGLKPGTYDFPDFLIIGPQRTGTTWLHRNLVFHPRVFIPPEKELYFFSNLIKKGAGKNFSSDRLEWYAKRFSTGFSTGISNFLRTNLSNVKSFRSLYALDFHFGKFFSAESIKGEATASYAVMDESLIGDVAVLNSDIRVIMLIRNPVDRAWSHAKMDLLMATGRSLDRVSFDEFEKYYTNNYQIKCGRYTNIIENWKRHIKAGRFFIGFFDDIIKNPRGLLTTVFTFLGITESARYVRNAPSKKVINPTLDEEMPGPHRELLYGLFEEEIRVLNDMFNLNWEYKTRNG